MGDLHNSPQVLVLGSGRCKVFTGNRRSIYHATNIIEKGPHNENIRFFRYLSLNRATAYFCAEYLTCPPLPSAETVSHTFRWIKYMRGLLFNKTNDTTSNDQANAHLHLSYDLVLCE